MFELNRVFPNAVPSADFVTTRFRLLERPEVQAELKLSPVQLRDVQKIYTAPSSQIPGLDGFIAEQRKKMSDLSGEALKSFNREMWRAINRIEEDFLSKELTKLLSRKQRERLDQLVIQAHGPIIIAYDTNVASALVVLPDQMEQIRSLLNKTDEDIIPELQRFGRGFISGLGTGETEESRASEMTNLIARLRRMIAERDGEILRGLTDGQRKKYRNLQGQPLKIEWDPWNFIRIPFEENISQ
ncbi:MAG: hypothetical protein JW719_11560 [Pirellulales bacterium]|nr:hypothetical protein [Pirellulales bacterium]